MFHSLLGIHFYYQLDIVNTSEATYIFDLFVVYVDFYMKIRACSTQYVYSGDSQQTRAVYTIHDTASGSILPQTNGNISSLK